MRRCVAVLLVIGFLAGLVPVVSAQDSVEPEPYSPDEFPQWALDLRRGEIITLGVFPIAYLLTSLVYDLFRFTRESIQTGQVAVQYAPLFFAPPDGPGYTREERRGILIATISVSTLVGVADYVLGRIEGRGGEAED